MENNEKKGKRRKILPTKQTKLKSKAQPNYLELHTFVPSKSSNYGRIEDASE